MSVLGVLNRAYHNNKQSIPHDHGTGLQPNGIIVGTYYQMVARIKRIERFGSSTSNGRLVRCTLEDHPFPPGDPTGDDNPTRQNPTGLNETSQGTLDVVSVAGLEGTAGADDGKRFDGEHSIAALDGIPGQKSDKKFIYFDRVNAPNPNDTEVVIDDTGWVYIAPRSFSEVLMDPARVMSHPSFPQREGEGIFTYPFPPDITRNFIYHPATKVDGVVQRTLSSNVHIVQPQLDEDTVITEIWLGGDRTLSTLTEMFRLFYAYWTTIPDAGQVLGWEPRDRTGDRFGIQLVRVQLGGLDFEYNEVRQVTSQNRDSYLDRQLTVQFKLARRFTPSKPQITLVGR